MVTELTLEVLRREAEWCIRALLGKRCRFDPGKSVGFHEAYDAVNDEFWLRIDYGKEHAFLKEVPHDYKQMTLDEVSKRWVQPMVRALPAMIAARLRMFRLRRMNARSHADNWRLPWLRRKGRGASSGGRRTRSGRSGATRRIASSAGG